MRKVLLNWAHVAGIEEHKDLKDGYVYVTTMVGKWENDTDSPDDYDDGGRLRQAVNVETFPAKDITVVGEGSMRVNDWLAEVAEKAEEKEQTND